MNQPISPSETFDAVTVTLNPAIDQTLTIADFHAGAVHRVQEETSVAGGKGVNVAAALADYGFRIAATGFLGQRNQDLFRQLFGRKYIADQFLRLDGATRTGIKITDPTNQTTTDINFPGLTPTPEDMADLKSRLDTLEATWVVLAGSLPPNVSAECYAELTAQLRAAGHRVALDSSGEALRAAIEAPVHALPHLIKPNICELETLLGVELPNQADIVSAARSLVARGIETVIVSMGADGAYFVTAQDTVFSTSFPVAVRSTVGAGDAMVAGFVAAQLKALPLHEAARLATAFAIDALGSLEAGLTSVAAIDELTRRIPVESTPF